MAPKKFGMTKRESDARRASASVKRSLPKKSTWTPPKQPTMTTRKEGADVVATSKYGTKYKPQAPGASKSVLQRVDELGGGAADFVFPQKTAGKIVKRQPLDAEDYLAIASLVPVPGVKAIGKGAQAVGKGAKALANPAPAYAATKETLPKAAKAASQGISVPRPSTRPGKSTEEALKYIAKKGGQGKGPRIPGDLVKRQRIRNLEKMLETGPAEQRAYTQGMLNALKPPSKAAQTIPPAKFPKGKKYKTEAPGRTKPLTDKEKNEIRDLMMPENIPGMSQSNARAITGRTKLSYAEAEDIAAKEKAAQEAIVASNKAEREAAKARGELPVGSKGILQEPQTLEDTMSKFPKPKPKPTKTKTDRAKALYQKRLDNWKAERDAWREKNTPERFRPKPKPESPLRKSEPAKAAEDAVPQRPADSKFKSRTAPAAVTKMKPEDWEIRAFTKSGKRMAADVPAQKALDKLTGKTPLDYGKKAAASKPAKPAKPVAEKPAETPAAATPKKPSTKKKTPEAPKAAEAKPVETPVETPAAPAAKKPSTEKKATAVPAAKTPAQSKAFGKKSKAPEAAPAAEKPAAKPKTPRKPKSTDIPTTYSKQKFGPAKPSAKRISAGKEDAAKRLSARTQESARDLFKRRKPSIIGRGITKVAPPVAKAATKVKESKFGKTTAKVNASKPVKISKAGTAAAVAATGVGALAVGGTTKPAASTKAKTTYQAGNGAGMFSIAMRNKARAEQAAKRETPAGKKFGAAGESKYLKGRSAVRQSVIDQINKQGMAKSLAAVQSRKNDPEYLEAIRRYYGAKRLKEALKG